MTIDRARHRSILKRPPLRCLLTALLRPLPNLLLIGAQKSGTTSLHALLASHPEICMAGIKECDELVRRRPSSLRYRAFFPVAFAGIRAGVRYFGESTPYYLFHPEAPRRARDMLPDPVAIAVLRDPVERAWSHYRHSVRFGVEPLGFMEALEREPERMASSPEEFRWVSYFSRGCYAGQLRRWFDALGRDRVLVLTLEDLVAGRAQHDIRGFLGLSTPFEQAMQRRNAGSPSEDPLPDEERRILRSRYAPHVAEVEQLLGRAFESWR